MSAGSRALADSQVTLTGRLGNQVAARQLPSGDTVTTFTVVVDRPAKNRRDGGPAVDAIPCQTFQASVARRVSDMPAGQWIAVKGSLRRRFWRSAAGLGSALEVEVATLTLVRP